MLLLEVFSSCVFITKNSLPASFQMPDVTSSLQTVNKHLDANEFGNFTAMLQHEDRSPLFSNNLVISDTYEAAINYTFAYLPHRVIQW